mgnify:CR=1 FL=1
MGYFSNSCEGDAWEAQNCRFCVHAERDGDEYHMCPVMAAHMLYAYDLCNEKDHPGKIILDLLIPENKDGLGNGQCAMLARKGGITEQHIRDWQKYKAVMAEMTGTAA